MDIGHPDNERADELARKAAGMHHVQDIQVSWAHFKSNLKESIYQKWSHRWESESAYRMTKIFYTRPCADKAKHKIKLQRPKLSKLVELITGQNNLK